MNNKETMTAPSGPNAKLNLDAFDYKSLTEENFFAYERFIDSLCPTESGSMQDGTVSSEQFDFEEYWVTPCFTSDINDLRGIFLDEDCIPRDVRIPIHMARDLNRQIKNCRANGGNYLLLKKP